MLEHVKNLAQFIRLAQTFNKKHVVMLGAGASLSSGVKLTKTIIAELVEKFAQGNTGDSIEDRFDRLWSKAAPDQRMGMLQPYLNQTPSSGYRVLAKLIKQGFFDEIITFNFDCLLEQALHDVGMTDFKVIIRGETADDAIAALLDAAEPRVKLLKLHGSLKSSNHFLFSKEEMFQYPEPIHAAVLKLTGRDLIVCGYAFNDKCVERALNTSKTSGSIHCVDPSGAPANLKYYLPVRRSTDNVISGELGKFDQFFEALHRELDGVRTQAPKRQNTFKFLDHYHEEQRSWFLGRRPLTFELVRMLSSPAVNGLWVSGRPKVGKTSLLRAALIPQLADKGYECVYLRCKPDIAAMLRLELERRGSPIDDLGSALAALKAGSQKPVVLLLDQFEKVCRAYKNADQALKQSILETSKALIASAGPGLRVVFVGIDEKALPEFFMKLRPPDSFKDVVVDPLSRKRVEIMIRYFSRRGGTPLSETLIRELCAEYEQGMAKEKPTFTLTHVQTICYYLMRGSYRNHSEYRQQPGLVAALDSIQEESNLIDMLDDLPPAQRSLLRNFLKVVCDRDSNNRTIVEFIRDHFLDSQDERFPEPLL